MEPEINLQKLEKVTASATFQTGLIEIGMGLIFLVSTLSMMFDDIRYYLNILYVLPVAFIMLGVKYIANPRMGVVKFRPDRVKRSRLMKIAITSFLVIMVTLTYFGNGNIFGGDINPRWIISGTIFSICVAIAYFMSFDRMYLYAFLLVGTFNLSEAIRENPGVISEGGYAYLLMSIIMMIIGSVYLAKFLKNNPLPGKK
jgi:hypothetical protein